MSTNKKGVCEVCGFADDSYRIEENGSVLKVCKFCHDGYLERMGLPPDADEPLEDVTMTLDLAAAGFDGDGAKVETLSEQELAAALKPDEKDKQVLQRINRRVKERDKRSEALKSALSGADGDESGIGSIIRRVSAELQDVLSDPESAQLFEDSDAKPTAEKKTEEKPTPPADTEKTVPTVELPAQKENRESAQQTQSAQTPAQKEQTMAKKVKKKREVDVLAEANPHIDDERIQITSPEVPLPADRRPKTNLDVAIKEYRTGVRFLDAFKYVFHRVTYTVYLAVLVVALTTAFFITKTWLEAIVTFAGGIGVIALSFLLMWYLSSRYQVDKRAYLLRIRQQEILFKSMDTDCYRELRTKFTVFKSLEWLLSKLSVVLPLAVIVAASVAAVIVAFLSYYWLFNLVLFGAILAGIVTYWLVKLCADVVAYKLDLERNQQIMQQTMLDILTELRK